MNAPLLAGGQMDRTKYLGGSDVAAILGISPWRTPLDVYLDKVQPRVRESDPARDRVLTRGKRMEPYVIDLLQEETGLRVVRRGERYIDPELSFIAAEIDAEAETGENIEIKTSSPFKSREWGEQQSDEIPVYYTAQAMHGLMVTGAQRCVFGVLIGADDFRVYQVERDEETIAGIRAKEQEFWQRVQRREPPEPSSVADIVTLYGARDSGASVECSEEIEADYIALRSITDDIKRLTEQAYAREERIKLFMAGASVLTLHGTPIATWKRQTALRLDQKALAREQSHIVEQYKRLTETRVFRLK